LIWVLNIDPTENNILTQLQVAVDALILNVSNLTATSEEQTEAISGLIISLNNIQTSLAVLSGQVSVLEAYYPVLQADIATLMESVFGTGGINEQLAAFLLQINDINSRLSVLEAYYPVLQADIATLMESVFGTGGINEQLAANTLAIDSILTEIGNISSYISTQISIINDQFIGVNSQIASIQSDILALESNVQALQISAVMSVSGLDVDNTNPQNPVVRLSVDGATITGQGTPASPLVANFTPVDSYLKYAAILSAEGSTDPVLTVLENTIGAIVWTRSSAANFRGTLSGAYTASKTMVFVTPIAFLSSSFPVIYTGNRASSNVVDIAAYRYNGSSWGLQDGFIYGCYIEIRVYP
jgi:archaellum component FlaC